MNPQKHQQGLLRRELVGAWRAIDAILEGWTENSRILTEEIQRLAEEIDQSKGTIRRQEAELKDLARQLAVYENHNNPSSKATLFAKKRKKHRRAAKEATASGASTATHTGKRGARPGSPGAAPAYRPDPDRTVECVKAGSQITVVAAHMPALADTAGFVDRVINQCGKGGVRIRTVLLDREFFSVGVIRMLERAGVGYLMPCPNTDGVVGAIREFAAGRRPAVSTNTIRRSKNEYVTYTMIITKRRRRKSKKQASTSNPEDIYIAFATNRPDIHLEKYACRWMIETGYRMIENQRVRTRSRTVAARTFCFLYSMLIYS